MILTSNKHPISPETSCDGNAPLRTAFTVAARASCWLLASLIVMALLLGGNSARAQQTTGSIVGTAR